MRGVLPSLLLCAIATQGCAAHDDPGAGDPPPPLLVQIARASVEAELHALVEGRTPDDALAPKYRDAMGERLAEAERRHRQLAEAGLVYTGFESTLDVHAARVDLTVGEAEVTAAEHTALLLPRVDDETPPRTQSVIVHRYRFHLSGGHWSLTAEERDDELTPRTNTQDETAGADPVPAASGPEAVGTTAQALTTINKSAIVNYARRYATSYNPNYRRWKFDCTNFVSQALAAGGWPHTGYWPYDGNAWFYNQTQSRTWVNANDFAGFAARSGRVAVTSNPYDLQPGDILQADFDGDGSWDHTMVVTKRDSADIYLTYHTTDRLDYPLKHFKAEVGSATKYRGYRIKTSF